MTCTSRAASMLEEDRRWPGVVFNTTCLLGPDGILSPEAIRQLAANGAEVLVRVSAYMDPWGATEPMSWWTIINRARAIENIAYVVAANQGAVVVPGERSPYRGRQIEWWWWWRGLSLSRPAGWAI